MLKLMIVDDEELERNGLRNCIDWQKLDVDVTGTFENGRDAYEAIKTSPLDILLTDIRMPIMNGLTLAEKVHVLSPQTKIIFLTGYEDFGYAKKAIDINATQYVLKPYEIDEIFEVIKKTVQQCKEEKDYAYEHELLKEKLKRSLPLLQEKFFIDIFHGLYQSQDERTIKKQIDLLDIPLLHEGEYFINIVEIDNFSTLIKDKDEYYEHILTLEVNEHIRTWINTFELDGFCINVSKSTFVVIISYSIAESNIYRNYRCIEQLVENLQEQYHADITIGIGKSCNMLSNLHIAYRQAQEALENRFTFGTNQIIYFGDIKRQDTIKMDMLLEKIKHNLLTLIEKGDDAEIEAQIALMFQTMRSNNAEKPYIQSTCIDIVNSLSKHLISNGIDIDQLFGAGASLIGKLLKFDTIYDTQMWIKNVIVLISRHLQQQNCSRNSKIVEKMKSIVEKRYGEDITVAEIASQVYLSAGYATMLFKKETGESLMRYIIKTRINVAKQLLSDQNTKISEASYAVGYSNLAYFTALFKNEVGISPKEYRDRYCQ